MRVLPPLVGAGLGALLGWRWCLHFHGHRVPGLELLEWTLASAGAGAALGLLDAFISAWIARTARPELALRLRLLLRAAALGAVVGVLVVLRYHTEEHEDRHLAWTVGGAAALAGGLVLWGRSAWAAFRRACAAPSAPRPAPRPGLGSLDVAWTAFLAAGLAALAGGGFLLAGGRELVEQMGRLGPLRWSEERAVCAFLCTAWLAIWMVLLARAGSPDRRTRLAPREVALGSGIALLAGPLWCLLGAFLFYS